MSDEWRRECLSFADAFPSLGNGWLGTTFFPSVESTFSPGGRGHSR